MMRSIAALPLLAILLFAGLAAPALAQVPVIDGVLVEPADPTPQDDIELVVFGRQSPECRFVLGNPTLLPDSSIFRIQASDPACDTPATEAFETRLPLGKAAAGFYEIQVRRGGQNLAWQEQFQVIDPSPSVFLHGEQFQALVEWSNPRNGSHGFGYARRLTAESATFWFFDPANVELTLKVLDGQAVNTHWWVFLASMTDLAVKVTVYDNRTGCLSLPVVPPACPSRVYEQAAGTNRNFQDTEAFFAETGSLAAAAQTPPQQLLAVEPPTPSNLEPVLVTASVLAPSDPNLRFAGVTGNRIRFTADLITVPVIPPPSAYWTATDGVGPLPAGPYVLELAYNDGGPIVTHAFRVLAPEPALVLHEDEAHWPFVVGVDWKLPSGETGQGNAVRLTEDSGYFWFFDSGNAEITIKILDGRPINGHWWVFIASMTNVEAKIRVTRCPPEGPIGAPCIEKIYTMPQGVNRNFLDTETLF